MGRWCEVKCNCPNRYLLNPEKFLESHYACGHPDGTVYQGPSTYLLIVGQTLNRIFETESEWRKTFEVFLSISNYECYDNAERLVLNARDRELWNMEIEELFRVEEQKTFFPYHAQEKWNIKWSEF